MAATVAGVNHRDADGEDGRARVKRWRSGAGGWCARVMCRTANRGTRARGAPALFGPGVPSGSSSSSILPRGSSGSVGACEHGERGAPGRVGRRPECGGFAKGRITWGRTQRARSRTGETHFLDGAQALVLELPFLGQKHDARRAPQDKSKRKEETSQVNGRHNRRVWRGGRTSGLGGRAAAAGRRGGVSFQGISTGLVTTTPIGPHKNLEMNALYTLGLNALRSTHTQSLRLRRPPPR